MRGRVMEALAAHTNAQPSCSNDVLCTCLLFCTEDSVSDSASEGGLGNVAGLPPHTLTETQRKREVMRGSFNSFLSLLLCTGLITMMNSRQVAG